MQIFSLPNADRESQAIAFSPNGRLLAAWDYGRVFVIDTASGSVRTLCSKGDASMSNVPGLGFTADSQGVIAQHETHPYPFLRVHDVDSGEVMQELSLTYGAAVEPGPGGRLVYLGSHDFQKSVEVFRWNPLTDEWLPEFARHKGYLGQLAVSADERWVAGSSGEVIRLWNIADGKLPTRALRQFKVEKYAHICCIALSSDGSFLASYDLQTRVWDTQTGEEWKLSPRESFGGYDFCREIAFHPSRPILAFSGKTHEVAFWDAAARAEVKRFAWDIGRISATAFSPDGLRCAAAGIGKVVVWDGDV